jgi:hypothetical protein
MAPTACFGVTPDSAWVDGKLMTAPGEGEQLGADDGDLVGEGADDGELMSKDVSVQPDDDAG